MGRLKCCISGYYRGWSARGQTGPLMADMGAAVASAGRQRLAAIAQLSHRAQVLASIAPTAPASCSRLVKRLARLRLLEGTRASGRQWFAHERPVKVLDLGDVHPSFRTAPS